MLLLGYIVLCQATGLAGARATRRGLKEWYATLRKPWFCPPNWIFGPVWSLLYLGMAVAAARVHADPVCRSLFALQLMLNATWSPLFFGLRRPGLALFNIALLWLAIGLCVQRFGQVDALAAQLMQLYWAWVSFATLLNFELFRLNRAPGAP